MLQPHAALWCVVPLLLTLDSTSARCFRAGGGAAAELTAWPEFHNGAASGLSLAAAPPPAPGAGEGGAAAGAGGAGGLLGRAWVTLARQEGPGYAQAGLLLALGLRRQLEQLTWTDLYRCAAAGRTARPEAAPGARAFAPAALPGLSTLSARARPRGAQALPPPHPLPNLPATSLPPKTSCRPAPAPQAPVIPARRHYHCPCPPPK